MDHTQKPKNLKDIRRQNVLESLKDIGAATTRTLKNDLLEKASADFFNQLTGLGEARSYSGDLTPGEALDVNELFSGRRDEKKKLQAQISLERNLASEEKSRIRERSDALALQLHALMQEVYKLAETTQGLGEEVNAASMQAPIEPGIYHLVFFEKLLEFIKSFRKKIENASLWLHSSNKRAEKKNYWAMYKKKGSSFLLAPDHYLQRSAG